MTKSSIYLIAFFTLVGGNIFAQNLPYDVKNLDINTEQADFGPAYYMDDIVYVSSKEGVRGIKRTWSGNHLPFLDIYRADVGSTNELTERRQFKRSVNKKFHDGPASFNKAGDLMVFTRNNYEGKSAEDIRKLKMFYSTKDGESWSSPMPFHFNSSEYSVGQPSLTQDGNICYFASDMPGGQGGVDIYKVTRTSDGSWSNPVNMGSKINTSGKEMFPSIHPSGVLFFSSTSHGSMGEMDIFACQLNDIGDPGQIVQLKAPLNSASDDFALIVDDEMKKGYFSSNRPGGKGDDDLYSVLFNEDLTFGKTIRGIAKDENGNPLPESTVNLTDERGNIIESVTTGPDGAYSFSAEPDMKYGITGNKDKYFDGNSMISTTGDQDVFEADVVLEKDPGFSLYCLVTDREDGAPISGVNISLVDNMTDEKGTMTTGETGDFRKGLKGKKLNDRITYNLKFEKDGYLAKTVTYNKLLDKPGQINIHEDLDIKLDKIDVGSDIGKIININPIYFDVNKDNIRPDAAIELDKIVMVMNENPTIEIELGSHTDCRASASYNQKLSDRRAKSSAKYIADKITNPERIYGKGYGESKLVNKCECEGSKKVPCTEDEHQMNRRTEFTIVKM